MGSVATVCLDPAGHPYSSLVTTTVSQGNPVFLISELAEHTKNLRQDPRCSLLLAEAGEGDTLALGRVTLLGECREQAGLTESAVKSMSDDYLAAHPRARHYVNHGDFSYWMLSVTSVRYIGGFGRMSWVSAQEWRAAAPDPLLGSAERIIAHMTADHKEAMANYCRAFTKAREFQDVTMTGVDRYGFEMSVETPQGPRPVRVAFPKVVDSADAVRVAFVDLAREARSKLGVVPET